jgi:hypothetical protein
MSGYLPKIRFDTEYEGDKVSIQMNALTRGAFVRVMPALEEARRSTANKMAVYDIACDVLNEHVESITGLRDGNGDAITKEAFLNAVYFVDLVTAAFNKLIQECSLGKAKSSDFAEKSHESTEGLQPTTSH